MIVCNLCSKTPRARKGSKSPEVWSKPVILIEKPGTSGDFCFKQARGVAENGQIVIARACRYTEFRQDGRFRAGR